MRMCDVFVPIYMYVCRRYLYVYKYYYHSKGQISDPKNDFYVVFGGNKGFLRNPSSTYSVSCWIFSVVTTIFCSVWVISRHELLLIH